MRGFTKLEDYLLIFIAVIMMVILFNIGITYKPEPAKAQTFGTNYVWLHKHVGLSTVEVDCTYTTRWESVFFKADTGDVLIKFATGSSYTDWATRPYYKLEAGESLSFGPGTPLTRAAYKSNAGTVDFFTLGYKKTSQY